MGASSRTGRALAAAKDRDNRRPVDMTLASWLPVLTGLTPHGLRHGHQTWMDEGRIADVLKSERMGHEVPGMRGVYSHVSTVMRAELTTALQER
jgi:integrase